MRNRMTRRKNRKNRKSRVQRGGGNRMGKHQQLFENGFDSAGQNDEHFYTCGERAIPQDTLLGRNVSNIRCVNGVIFGLNAPPGPMSVRNRILALKNANPPPAKGRLGGRF